MLSEPDEIDFSPIWAHMTSLYRLGEASLHGPDHWRRVEAHAIRLAEANGADLQVARLFAVLHDVMREDEGIDPEHGLRAAALARRLRGKYFELDEVRFGLLEHAIALHAHGRRSADLTIGTCWDADRLDLPRVGVWPRAEFLSTPAGVELLAQMERKRRMGQAGWPVLEE